MSRTLKQQMIGAVKWSAIDRFGQQAIQFVIGIILARLLGPNEYGIIGMVMIFSAISFVLVESGFGQALIRKQDANDTDFSTIFYFNLFVSVTLYTVLFFSTPLIAQFFKEPLLVPVGRVIFLSIIFNAFYLVSLVQLTKEMNYKIIAKVNLISTSLSGALGVLFAFMGYGVWSLVYQQVLFHFLRMVFYYLFKRWHPKWLFSFHVIRSFWAFSIHLLGTSLLNAFFNYIYVLIIGRFYVKRDVGYYTQANKLSETINFTFQTIIGSSYSLFAQIQDEDERFKRIFREVAQKISLVVFPVLLVVVGMAKPLVFVLLSEKWLPSVPYFQLLCLAAIFVPLYTLNISALNSRGKSKITFKIELIKKALILFSILVLFKFGIVAMLFGYIVASFIAFLIAVYSLKKEIGHFIKHQIDDMLLSFLIGLVIATISYLLSYLFKNDYLLLVSQMLVSVVLYIVGVRLFFRELFDKTINLLIQKITKK